MIFLFTVLALLCEIIGTIGGFGSSVFFVPLAGFFFDFKIVLGLTGILHVFSNLAKIILFGKHTNYRLLWLFGIPSVIMVVLGAWLVTKINTGYEGYFLGTFLILFSVFFYLNKTFVLPPNKTNAIAGGSISGFLAGLIGTGGAIRGASMAAFNLDKNVFVATSAAVDMGVDLTRTVIYLDNGFVGKEYIYIAAILFAVSFVGSYLGKLILNKIRQEDFKKIVLAFLFLIGIATLVGAIL